MCMNCGCGEINERHGSEANIVADDIRRAAEAAGQDIRTTVRNLMDSLHDVEDPQMASSGVGSATTAREADSRKI